MGNILAIDRGTKYIGAAYRNEKSELVMPIGWLMNDSSLFFNIGGVLERYHIKRVVVGRPEKEEKLQESINEFIQNILFIDREIEVVKINEDYSSVQAGAVTNTFTKDEKEDTLAAMQLLQDYIDNA